MLIQLLIICKSRIYKENITQLFFFYYSWFRMIGSDISEGVLVDLNNQRYFQHGGNLMVIVFF